MMRALSTSILTLLLLTSCGTGSSYESDEGYESEYREEYQEIGNPYSPGTGHYAGYEWAERTGGYCDGNSQSFNEGCETYHDQSGY